MTERKSVQFRIDESLAEIDALIDSQLERGPVDDYSMNYYPEQAGRCPWCTEGWHGLPITKAMQGMRAYGHVDEDYTYASDDSGWLCPGSDYYGPIHPSGYWCKEDREQWANRLADFPTPQRRELSDRSGYTLRDVELLRSRHHRGLYQQSRSDYRHTRTNTIKRYRFDPSDWRNWRISMEHDQDIDELYAFGRPDRSILRSSRTYLEIEYEGRLEVQHGMTIPEQFISEWTLTGTRSDQVLWARLRSWRVEIKQIILYAHTPEHRLEEPSRYDEARRPNEPQYIDVDTYANPLELVWWNEFWKELGDAPEQP